MHNLHPFITDDAINLSVYNTRTRYTTLKHKILLHKSIAGGINSNRVSHPGNQYASTHSNKYIVRILLCTLRVYTYNPERPTLVNYMLL